MVVHGPFPPDARVAREVRTAVAEGWEVDLLATRQPEQAKVDVVEGALVMRLPIEHRWGAGVLEVTREYLGFTLLASMRAAILAARRRYRVIQVHNPPDFLVLSAVLPKLLGGKLVLDVHDLSPDMFAMRFGERSGAELADRILRMIERFAMAFADAVITVHEPYRRELAARGVPMEKIAVVMNTVDEQVLPPARKPRAENGFRVVYQGTLTPPYGADLLVEAMAKIAAEIPEAQLEIYGDGDRLVQLRQLAGDLGVADRVWFSGRFLPQSEVLARVQSASAGVVPNLPSALSRYALSTKLFEYVALGLPVVSADLPTITEYFGDDEVLFFEAGNAEALAKALLEVQRHPDATRSRCEAALRRYEAYRWETSAKRYAELLSRVTSRPA
jgi:glycosyltransferase involved in cell wall biosynthesis